MSDAKRGGEGQLADVLQKLEDLSKTVREIAEWRLVDETFTQQTQPSYDANLVCEEWVERVAKTRDADLRAHRIALTYHHFSRAMDEYIFGEDSVWKCSVAQRTPQCVNANWFCFGTWATISINRDIRNQRPPLRSERVLPVSLRPWLSPTILNIKASDGQRISRVLSWGQRLVFISTTLAAYEMKRLADKQDEGAGGAPAGADDTTPPLRLSPADVKKIRTGGGAADPGGDDPAAPPPLQPSEKLSCETPWAQKIIELASWDGSSTELQIGRHLETIIRGLNAYGRARDNYRLLKRHMDAAEPDEHTVSCLSVLVARQILLGNILITAVEQDVVQRPVTTVMEHVPRWFANAVTARAARASERFIGVPRQLAALDIPLRVLSARSVLTSLWARVMTDQILVMMLPTETLRLGRDIPPMHPSKPYFPAPLRDLSDPAAAVATTLTRSERVVGAPSKVDEREPDDVSVRRIVTSFDRTRGDGVASGARDWRRYDDRMNWAVTLIRSRQGDQTLFWSPYSAEDGQLIRDGKLPTRVGDPTDFDILAPLYGVATDD